MDQERLIARFEPTRGVIPPRTEILVKVLFTVQYGGPVNELLICNIDDIEIPLGVEVTAESFGLNVSYETAEQQIKQLRKDSKAVHSLESTLDGIDMSMSRSHEGDSRLSHTDIEMRMLNFQTCTINKVSYQKFIIKNLSGIKTNFKFTCGKFEPPSHQPHSTRQHSVFDGSNNQRQQVDSVSFASKDGLQSGRGSAKQIRFAPSTKSASNSQLAKTGFRSTGSAALKKRERFILSDEHEETQKFSSVTGTTHTMTKKLEKEASYFLSNNKGIAIVFNP